MKTPNELNRLALETLDAVQPGTWFFLGAASEDADRHEEPLFDLQGLYDLLQCKYIEVVTLQDGKCLIIDEEGKLGPLPVLNRLASKCFALAHVDHLDAIVGHAILCQRSDLP